MYPHERSLVRKLADKPFAIIGVNSDRDLEKTRVTAAEKSISWRSFWNGEKGTSGPISKKWQISSWPSTFLLDKDGVIRYKNLRGPALDKAIETLMAEMGEEVELAGVDHEAEDEEAMKKAKALAAAKAAPAPPEVKPEEEPKPAEPATKEPSSEKTESPKPATEEPKAEEPKAEEPKAEEPKAVEAEPVAVKECP